ncbi:MAG TPA: sister chromatid cohesion protein PDS5 [Planctomycetaceae bacterium]|jgi:beta-lactamase regulating signal transducer with metallopeptidase domain/HEAT repeat protein|nr:sister chromatid cohesion protein PDS5 [Planctomycetaceae bacterium]
MNNWLLPWWDAIGWSMLHFLWIGAVLGFVSGLLRWMVRGQLPATRYAVSLLMLAIMALTPVCLFVWTVGHRTTAPGTLSVDTAMSSAPPTPNHLQPARPTTDAARSTSTGALRPSLARGPLGAIDDLPADEGEPVSWTGRFQRLGNRFASVSDTVLHVLPWLWIVGFPLTCLWLLTGIAGAERLRRRSQVLRDDQWLRLCRGLQDLLHVSVTVSFGISDRISAPILVGILRPMILLPAATIARWPPEQIEMILLHELAHIRRSDNLVNLLQRFVEAVLFFHPAVWWLSNQVRLEREHCCDAVVLAHSHSPQSYAELLAQIAIPEFTRAPVLAVSAAEQLVARIRQILKPEDQPMQVSRTLTLLLSGVSISVIGLSVAWANKETSRTAAGRTELASASESGAVKTIALADEVQTNPLRTHGDRAEKKQPSSVKRESLRFDGKTFDEWRERMMTELKPELRAEAITALGRFGPYGYGPEAATAIGKFLSGAKLISQDAGDEKVKQAANLAYLRIGAPAVPALVSLLKDMSPEVRQFAARSLGGLLPNQPTANRPVFDAIALLTTDPDFWVRSTAFSVLRATTPTKVDKSVLLRTAIERLKDEHPQIRCEAADMLGVFGRSAESAIPPLLATLKDPRNKEKEAVGYGANASAISALIKVGAPPALVVPALIDLIRDAPEDRRSHFAAFAALTQFGPAGGEAVPVLIDAFTRADHIDFGGVGEDQTTMRRDEQIQIAVALRSIGPKARAALPILEKALANEPHQKSLLHEPLKEAISKINATSH